MKNKSERNEKELDSFIVRMLNDMMKAGIIKHNGFNENEEDTFCLTEKGKKILT